MQFTRGVLALAALIVSSAGVAADFMDLSLVDRAVAHFTGADVGLPGGARAPVDRRLKLRACAAPLALSWQGRAQDSVAVACPVAGGWRVFVPVAAAPRTEVAAAAGPAVVARGETVTIAVSGSGFTLTRQGQAMEAGAVGDWIRVKPQGNKAEPIRARIVRAGLVGMDLP